ncbi:MAG TPA: DUF4190 domain-containing protein, partial [Blastocatellia bacterium]|nr:DUF4190 domain-containing protein [Blastocatellia bacterium]
SLKKTCQECGMPLSVGVANCSYCGATVGTLFSEASVPAVAVKSKRRNVFNEQASYYDRIENAKERANKSVILALTGFFPFIGFFMGVAAIVLGALASKTLKAENVEDGRGSATAGLIIGALALIAQGGYVVYVMKSGNLPFAG